MLKFVGKAIIAEVFGVVGTPQRNCVLNHSPKRIKRIIFILKDSTTSLIPNALQEGLSSTSPQNVALRTKNFAIEPFKHPTINLARKTKIESENSEQHRPAFQNKVTKE